MYSSADWDAAFHVCNAVDWVKSFHVCSAVDRVTQAAETHRADIRDAVLVGPRTRNFHFARLHFADRIDVRPMAAAGMNQLMTSSCR